MNETSKEGNMLPPVEATPPTNFQFPPGTQITTINFDELKPNSVVVIKIQPEGMQQRMAATQQIAFALRPLRDRIKEKNVAFIVMGVSEGMDVLDESQMNELGWEKKKKSLIILPK